MHYRLLILLVALSLLIVACGGSGDTSPVETISATDAPAVTEIPPTEDNAMSDDTASDDTASDEMASDEMASDEMASDDDTMTDADTAEDLTATEAGSVEVPAEPEETMAERPVWQTMELRDAHTGETFTLADYAGKTVFVEPMATWCSNCRAQLNRLKDAYATLGTEDYAFIALSVETNIDSERLASYADGQEFPFKFAVLTPDMLAELVREFGSSISSPPSTPHFIIRPDGTFTSLTTGPESADQIISNLREASGS